MTVCSDVQCIVYIILFLAIMSVGIMNANRNEYYVHEKCGRCGEVTKKNVCQSISLRC